MKRFLTVGIIFGVLVVIVVLISWLAIPAWRDPASGGFWTLVGAAAVGVLAFVKDVISIWKELKEPKPAAPAPLQAINSQSAGQIYNAPGGTINIGQASGAPPPVAPTPQYWRLKHPYPMPPNFTGRVEERSRLTAWLNGAQQPLTIVRALGGFGKSALVWHWLNHDVDKATWKRVIWWSFYEGDSSFENFLGDTLEYLVGNENVASNNPRQQSEQLLGLLHEEGILLVLDGFERALRAFSGMGAAYQGDDEEKTDDEGRHRDCVSPAADVFLRGLAALPDLKSKVLMTTRLRPRALEYHGELLAGCDELELKAMSPADAVDFFRAQKIKGERAEIEAACAPFGCHPLSLRLLAGLIAKDKRQPLDIAAASRYADTIGKNTRQRQHHVLEQAYQNLSPELRRFLSRVACFRGAVDYDAIAMLAKDPEPSKRGVARRYSKLSPSTINLDTALDELVTRGLLHQDTTSNRFDLHPIVRRYAYDRLASNDRAAAHQRLADYFAAVPEPQKVEKLDDLAAVIELYHHMVRAGKLDEACDLFYDWIPPTFYQFGAYQLHIELLSALFPDGENGPPRLKKESDQAWALSGLANSYSASGQPRRAVSLFEIQIAMRAKQGDKENLGIGLGNVATQQLVIGALAQAERSLRRSIDLSREIEDELMEAVGRQDLGWVLTVRGAWQAAEQELAVSTKYNKRTNDVQGVCLDESYRALRYLLMAREAVGRDPLPVAGEGSSDENLTSAIGCAQRALELADEDARTDYPVERDYVRAHWLLGAAYRAYHDLPQAEMHLGESLRRCRAINMVDHEADILLEMAKLCHAQGATKEALRLAGEALIITERSGYVLQGADVHLWLAELALTGVRREGDKGSDQDVARMHARQARELATGWEMVDGKVVYDQTGQYVYKVAYDQAGALLER